MVKMNRIMQWLLRDELKAIRSRVVYVNEELDKYRDNRDNYNVSMFLQRKDELVIVASVLGVGFQ